MEEREGEEQQMKEQEKEAADDQGALKGQEQEQEQDVSLLVSVAGPRGVLSQATDLLLSWQYEDDTQQSVQIY